MSDCPPPPSAWNEVALGYCAPPALVVVNFSGKLCMRVLMCLSVLSSAWARCAYVVWIYGVVVGSFGSGCVDGDGL